MSQEAIGVLATGHLVATGNLRDIEQVGDLSRILSKTWRVKSCVSLCANHVANTERIEQVGDLPRILHAPIIGAASSVHLHVLVRLLEPCPLF